MSEQNKVAAMRDIMGKGTEPVLIRMTRDQLDFLILGVKDLIEYTKQAYHNAPDEEVMADCVATEEQNGEILSLLEMHQAIPYWRTKTDAEQNDAFSIMREIARDTDNVADHALEMLDALGKDAYNEFIQADEDAINTEVANDA